MTLLSPRLGYTNSFLSSTLLPLCRRPNVAHLICDKRISPSPLEWHLLRHNRVVVEFATGRYQRSHLVDRAGVLGLKVACLDLRLVEKILSSLRCNTSMLCHSELLFLITKGVLVTILRYDTLVVVIVLEKAAILG